MSRKRRKVVDSFRFNRAEVIISDRSPSLIQAVRASIEGLERRLFLSATITPTNILNSTDTESISVDYTSSAQIDPSTFGNGDISVTDASGNPLSVKFVSSGPASTDVVANYTVSPPSQNGWTLADDGNYTVTLPGNSPTDTTGQPLGPAGATFQVAIPDTTAPTANINAPSDVNSASNNPVTVTVVYNDDVNVKGSTLADGNLKVTGTAGNLPVSLVSANPSSGDAQQITATYSIAAPSGGWAHADNGTYTIALGASPVQDTSGNNAVGGAATFDVNVPIVDITAPVASISAPSISSAGGTTESVTITYTDDIAVRASTISKTDLTITGPSGPLTVQSVNFTGGNATSITAIYVVTAPGGKAWSAADNGNYSITLGAGKVTDTSGNGVAAKSASFSVNIPVPDTTPPTAVISAPSISSSGGNTESISVTYADNDAVKASSIAKSNLTVTGPSGPLTVQSVSAPGGDAGSITVTYLVAAPGGKAWSSADNGNYTIALAAGSVTDVAGNGVAAGSQNFNVNIPVPDTTPPTATISAANVTAPGGSNEIVTVTYSDSGSGVDASTVNSGSVTVNGPGGPLSLVSLSKLPSVNGPTVSAVYTFAAPGGAWSPTANGSYTISVVPGHVMDVANNAIAGTTATFTVNAGIIDTAPPIAVIAAPDINSPGGTSETIVVTYSDGGSGVDPQSIGIGDITVSGPGGNLTVSSVHKNTTAGGVVATYTVGSPNGQPWNASDNGGYTVSIVPGGVKDLAGNGIAASSGGFSVNATVPDTAPPVASISAPGIVAASTAPQIITVTYADPNSNVSASTLGIGNISVSGPQGPLNVTDFSASSTGDAPSLTVTYTVTAPLGGWSNLNNGTYTVAVNANQVKDPSGNSAAVATAAFTVNVAAPGDPSDTTFNGGQPVTAPFVAETVVTLPDGQLMLAGHEGNSASGTSQGVLELLNSDGSVDTSFGTSGMAVTPAGENFAYYTMVLQGSNHLIVAGGNGADFLLQRFDLNGNLDATFGSSGTELSSLGGSNDTAYSLALTASGQIVAGGASSGNFAFARYDANGHLDPAFAQGGLQLFQVGSSTGAVGAIALQSNGDLVAAGSAGAGVAVVRLDANGEADPSFGNGGLAMVNALSVNQNLGTPDHAEGLALQGDDILVAKHTSSGHFGLVRLLPDGSVDASFGAGGIASADFGGTDDADSIIQESTGQILVLGTSLQNNNPMTAVAAFDSAGNPLADFGSGGKATFAAAASTTRELHIGDLVTRAFGTKQNNGQVIVGTSGQSNSSPSTTALRRLIVPGSVGAQPAESFLGAFGTINKKNVKLTFTTPDGTSVSLALKGATGNAFLAGDQVRLSITQVGSSNVNQSTGTSLTVTTRGGNRSVNFGNITVNGALKSITARSADLFGTLYASQSIGTASLRNIESGAAIVSDGPITTLNLASLTSAKIISGASLDSTGLIDGSTTYGPGKIRTVTISGAATNSLVAAGVDPIAGNFLDSADTAFGGVASLIQTFSAHGGIDAVSHLVSGKITTVRGPKLIKQPDPRIVVLPG